MCTYLTEKVSISGSGKGPSGWFRVTDASVYFDHPGPCPGGAPPSTSTSSTPAPGPAARVAVELTAESARAPGQGHPGHPGLRPRPGSASRGDDPP